MTKVTASQRHKRMQQPYTRIEPKTVPRVEATPSGPTVRTEPTFQVWGYTFEQKFVDEEWTVIEEEHDLGQEATLPGANDVARKWRDDLVGQYPIG